MLPLVCPESFDRPFPIKSIFRKFDPATAGCALVSRCNIYQNRAVVGWVNDLVPWAAGLVMPFKVDLFGVLALPNELHQVGQHTLSPALTESVFAVAALLTLHVISFEVTSTRGELFGGERIYPEGLLPKP